MGRGECDRQREQTCMFAGGVLEARNEKVDLYDQYKAMHLK